MKKIISILLFSCTFVILSFLILSDFEQGMTIHLQNSESGLNYAALSFLFLLFDIILPVPSSLLMILNGKLLGLFPGALLSLVSGVFSSVLGYYLGRKSGTLFNSLLSKKELEEGNRLFYRYGNVGIGLSRALPVLAEAVSFLAGTTALPFRTFLLFSFTGQLVVAVIYAYIGTLANAIDSMLVSGMIIGITLLLAWGIQQLTVRKKAVPQG